jgi:hypothetical protein
MNTRTASRAHAAGVITALCIALAGAPAAGLDLTGREILATGDVVDGFGRIGVDGVAAQGIDDRGRLLVSGQISSGGDLLFWVDGDGLTPLWSGALPGGAVARPLRAVTNAGGDVVAAGFETIDENEQNITGLYAVGRDGVRPLVHLGDTPAGGGNPICYIQGFTLNDAGTVAVLAQAAPAGAACNGVEIEQLYTVTDGVLHAVPAAFPTASPPHRHLLGIANDGTLLVDLDDADTVVSIRGGETRVLAADGMFVPEDTLLYAVRGWAANAAGDVAFSSGYGGAIFRTDAGRIVPVAAAGDRAPDGSSILYFEDWTLQLSDAGDVAVSAAWVEPDGTDVTGTLIYPVTGPPRMTSWAEARGINSAGDVALESLIGAAAAMRWRGDDVTPFVVTGEIASNGQVFATGGLDDSNCLAPDGRVAASVTRNDWQAAFVCAGAAGAAKIAERGDPAPEGGRFVSFYQCAFPADGSIVFSATRTAASPAPLESNVYRAMPTGFERVAGPGSRTTDGTVVVQLAGPFAVNGPGTALVSAQTSAGERFLRRRPGGPLEVVRFDLGDGSEPPHIFEAGLAADDTVIAIATGPPGISALLASDGAHATVLATSADADLPGSPLSSSFFLLRVQGERIVFSANDVNDETRWIEDTAAAGFSALPIPPSSYLLDLATNSLLYDRPDAVLHHQFVLDTGGTHPITTYASPTERHAEALNDRGNLLFAALGSPGAARSSLELTGPTPAGAPCFIPPTAVTTIHATPTPQPPTPTPDCTDEQAGCARLRVGSASGRPGGRVTVAVTLDSGSWPIAGVECDLTGGGAVTIASQDGHPACRVNPAIRKQASAFAFRPPTCDGCTTAHALILAFDNVDPIPSGSELFECDVTIAADAQPGRYALTASNLGASDPDGGFIGLGVSPGAIDVRAGGTGSQGSRGLGTQSAGGCQIEGRHRSRGWWFVAPAVLLLCLRRAAALRGWSRALRARSNRGEAGSYEAGPDPNADGSAAPMACNSNA